MTGDGAEGRAPHGTALARIAAGSPEGGAS